MNLCSVFILNWYPCLNVKAAEWEDDVFCSSSGFLIEVPIFSVSQSYPLARTVLPVSLPTQSVLLPSWFVSTLLAFAFFLKPYSASSPFYRASTNLYIQRSTGCAYMHLLKLFTVEKDRLTRCFQSPPSHLDSLTLS